MLLLLLDLVLVLQDWLSFLRFDRMNGVEAIFRHGCVGLNSPKEPLLLYMRHATLIFAVLLAVLADPLVLVIDCNELIGLRADHLSLKFRGSDGVLDERLHRLKALLHGTECRDWHDGISWNHNLLKLLCQVGLVSFFLLDWRALDANHGVVVVAVLHYLPLGIKERVRDALLRDE